jgi:uroporphyrinogen-III decarboxylase
LLANGLFPESLRWQQHLEYERSRFRIEADENFIGGKKMPVINQTGLSKQRVLDTINHRTPDRVPVDFGATAVTGIHASCVAALREHFQLEKRPVKVHEPFQMLGLVEDDLRQALCVDVQGVFRRGTMFGFKTEDWKPWCFNGLEVLVPGKFSTTITPAGDTLIYPGGDLSAKPSGRMPKGFHFFDAIIRQDHFDPDRLNPEDNLEEFQPLTEEDLDEIAADTAAADRGDCALLASFGGTALGDIALVPTPNLADPRGIRDVTEWYISTRSRRDYIHQIFSRQVEIGLANLARIHARIGNTIDILFLCGTDFGTQTSSFCSVPTFRELWFPYYKQMCDWIHRNTAWKIFKHSCGSSERFYESFIEAGIDVINPVQCSAVGMDPEFLKSKYGDRLVFWGGGIDTQHILPFGTPSEVREQVLRRCEIFSKNGGFVFNAVHNVQAGTPVANIVAMIEAVKEFNGEA